MINIFYIFSPLFFQSPFEHTKDFYIELNSNKHLYRLLYTGHGSKYSTYVNFFFTKPDEVIIVARLKMKSLRPESFSNLRATTQVGSSNVQTQTICFQILRLWKVCYIVSALILYSFHAVIYFHLPFHNQTSLKSYLYFRIAFPHILTTQWHIPIQYFLISIYQNCWFLLKSPMDFNSADTTGTQFIRTINSPRARTMSLSLSFLHCHGTALFLCPTYAFVCSFSASIGGPLSSTQHLYVT